MSVCCSKDGGSHRSREIVTGHVPSSPVKPSTPPPPKPRPAPGGILGKPLEDLNSFYELGKELGRGQFSVTRVCTDKSTGHLYACKSISKRKLSAKQDKEDVKKEVQIMQHLTVGAELGAMAPTCAPPQLLTLS